MTNHRTLTAEKLLSPWAKKHLLIIGIGGGGDIISTLPLAYELQQSFQCSCLLAGLSWKRVVHDPLALPRTMDQFSNMRRFGRTLGFNSKDTSVLNTPSLKHVEADLTEFSYAGQTLSIDPSFGSQAVLDDLQALIIQERIEGIIGVDVGGDALCYGDEETLESPLCDQLNLSILAELAKQGQQTALVVSSIGSDGELQPSSLLKRFDTIYQQNGYRGAIEPPRSFIPTWQKILKDAKTESSSYALCALQSLSDTDCDEIRAQLNTSNPAIEQIIASYKTISLRNGARTGFTSALTPFQLFFNPLTVWSSSFFSQIWRADFDLVAMAKILNEHKITTEFGEKRL